MSNLLIYELIPSEEGKTILNNIIFDFTSKFIISATSEKEARETAQDNSYGDECHSLSIFSLSKGLPFWTDSKYSICKVIGISKEKKCRIIANVFING